jgi:putative oxidoreductase
MIAYIVIGLQFLLALVFVGSGVTKLTSNAKMIEEFQRWGYSKSFMYFVGACEVTGAIGLLVGYFFLPSLRLFPALGLFLLMIGAVFTHIKAGDDLQKAAPAVVFCSLLGLLAFRFFEFS